jgi:glycosyltransferase involved in cell wall biosynthesis
MKLKEDAGFDYRLMIAGDGEERDNLIKLADKYCNKDIVFLGNIDYFQVAEYMSKSRIYVQPTVNMEGHPRALIEAMSSGCACIATNVDGNKDIIRDLENGILINPRNEEELYENIKKLASDMELCTFLAAKAFSDSRQYGFSGVFEKETELLKHISLINQP